MLTSDNMAVAIERGVTEDWFEEHADLWGMILEVHAKTEWNKRTSVSILRRAGVYNSATALELSKFTPEWAHRAEEVSDA